MSLEKHSIISFLVKELQEVLDKSEGNSIVDSFAEHIYQTYHNKPALHPRFELEKAELRYLTKNGWHLLAPGDAGLFCCKPEDTQLVRPMSLDKAIAEQKFRDLFKRVPE